VTLAQYGSGLILVAKKKYGRWSKNDKASFFIAGVLKLFR
jgi:hypothetical protein